MKSKLNILAVCAALALASGPLFAQSHDHDHDHHHDKNHHYKGMYDQGRHEGWYKRGGHVPTTYRSGRYEVKDWRHEHLRQPPHGYHYVRSDNGDYLLVAITTGIIASIIAHQH